MIRRKQGIIKYSLFFCHKVKQGVASCRTIFGIFCKILLTSEFFCDKLNSQSERRVTLMTQDNKITELRAAFDKIVNEWDIEKLYSPRLVQMARSIEDQMLALA